jgi:3-hydroxy-9,10-secoandrosta-1,3,5(10)-triene-9,17-dione monooxygenase reductase component
MEQNRRFDPKEFRSALGAFATGVTVITALDEDGSRVGITANSFNSVSLDPPMVLFSLAKSARSLTAFSRAQYWAVHILGAGQEALSNRFARSGEDKFAGLELEAGIGGAPLLGGCAARMQCRSAFRYEGGDHLIFVGEVLAFDRCESAPLVFHGGRYALATRKSAELSLSQGAAGAAGFDENFLGYLLARAHFQFYERVRDNVARHGLDDTEYFVLSVLSVQDGRSLARINAHFAYTGQAASEAIMAGLCGRGLLLEERRDGEVLYRLSGEGRSLTLQLIAAAKALEAEVLGQLGEWDAAALRNLVKQLVLLTNQGHPHPWDAAAAA